MTLNCGMNTRSRGLTGLGIAGGTVALLANVGGAHDTLTDLWPVVAALSPVLASALLVVGLALVGEVAWRWYAPHRPSERFRRLVPKIQNLSEWMRPDRVGRHVSEKRLRTATELETLRVGLPQDQVDVLRLLYLAEQGELRAARKKYPLTDAKKNEMKTLERVLRGHTAPR